MTEDWKNNYVYVISTRRPDNVKRMQELIGDNFVTIWIVNDMKDVNDYMKDNNDNMVIKIGGDLVTNRNTAIEDAFSKKKDCIMVDDDLKRIKLAQSKQNKESLEIPFEIAIFEMMGWMKEIPQTFLFGIAPTTNAFFYNPAEPISFNKFVRSALMIIRYDTDLRFDNNLKLKEDYDYTLQHIKKYGGAARINNILADFQLYNNKGGAVDYRTEQVERESIKYLQEKWGYDVIRNNPKRRNEILLNLRR